MLTPQFKLAQTNKHVVLTIIAPMANVGDAELYVDDYEVLFHSSPYYLRLRLPGPVKEKEGDYGTYHADVGTFEFTLYKVNEGEDFKDLDLLGKLLLPSRKHQIKQPDIGLMEDPETDSDSDVEEDWYIHQQVFTDDDSLIGLPKYGFANKTQGNERELREEFNEIIELRDVNTTPVIQRGPYRMVDEEKHFSEDHYLADLMDPSFILVPMEFVPPWQCGEEPILTDEEKMYLKNLGNRDYLLDSKERKIALLSLADILFAYAYDYRTSEGEVDNVESAWAVNKLSATLSWFQVFQDMKEVKIACFRRALTYPLYRHYKYCLQIFDDTHKILLQGRRRILKCLIQIHKMFNLSEPRYLLNNLYITDYCIWVQKLSDKKIAHLALYFGTESVTKDEIGFDLDVLETAAYCVKTEEDMNNITNNLTAMNVSPPSSVDSESDSEPSDSVESSESEEDSDSSTENNSSRSSSSQGSTSSATSSESIASTTSSNSSHHSSNSDCSDQTRKLSTASCGETKSN